MITPLYVEKTTSWWAATWQLQDVLPFPPMWIYAAYIAAGIAGLALVVDVLMLAARAMKKRKARKLDQESSPGGKPVDVE